MCKEKGISQFQFQFAFFLEYMKYWIFYKCTWQINMGEKMATKKIAKNNIQNVYPGKLDGFWAKIFCRLLSFLKCANLHFNISSVDIIVLLLLFLSF